MTAAPSPETQTVHATKLFTASCLALLATSVSFAVVSAITHASAHASGEGGRGGTGSANRFTRAHSSTMRASSGVCSPAAK